MQEFGVTAGGKPGRTSNGRSWKIHHFLEHETSHSSHECMQMHAARFEGNISLYPAHTQLSSLRPDLKTGEWNASMSKAVGSSTCWFWFLHGSTLCTRLHPMRVLHLFAPWWIPVVIQSRHSQKRAPELTVRLVRCVPDCHGHSVTFLRCWWLGNGTNLDLCNACEDLIQILGSLQSPWAVSSLDRILFST